MAVRTINRSIAPVRASWDKKVWGKQERLLVSRSIWKPRHDKVPVTLAKKKSTPQEMLAPFWNILPQLKKVFKSRKTYNY